jgi:hypothetical protein
VLGGQAGDAGALTMRYDAANGVTLIEAFTDSDAVPDIVIALAGSHADLTASDFVL